MADPTVVVEPELERSAIDRSNRAAHASLLASDSTLGSFFHALDVALTSPLGGAPGSHALDPFAVGRWLVNVGTQLGARGIGFFLAEQQLLYAMNPQVGEGRVFDPKYFLERLPVLNSIAHVTLDDQGHRDVAREKDFALVQALRQSDPVPIERTVLGDIVPGQADIARLNVYGDVQGGFARPGTDDQAEFTIRQMVDATLDGDVGAFQRSTTLPGGIVRNRVDLSLLFVPDPVTLGQKPSVFALEKTAGERVVRGPLEAAAYADGIVPASFPREDGTSAYEHLSDDRPVPDDETYVPLSFTDLRPVGGQRLRTVYIRPFNLTFSEDISPDWSEANYYGRVDPVLTYQGTTRTVNLSFDMVAFAPEDLKVIYQKLNWLASMVYPEYDAGSLIRSGPVCRLRLGDVVQAGGVGLPGAIRNLNYDYSEAPWELKAGYKVPRNVGVSLSFTVLHRGPVGRDQDGGFDGRHFFRDFGPLTAVPGGAVKKR